MYYMILQQLLPPAVLDTLLAHGYYRMRQTIFTTSYIVPDEAFAIEVLWARILLSDYRPGKLHRTLTRRNSGFERTLTAGRIDEEIETLYAAYTTGVAFDAPETVAAFLQGEEPENYFGTRMWQLRDRGRLIAVGYFDEGEESAAGILNFYHPDYKQYSLGKWLYLESVEYAAHTGKRYFYPGYIALDYTKFDYKLIAGKDRMEIWVPETQSWIPYALSRHAGHPQTGSTAPR